jgi:hypothetical protein
MTTKKISVEFLLADILKRLSSMEDNSSVADKALDVRLCKIEAEIENVKRAAKTFSIFVKIITGLVAFIVMIWNFVGKFLIKK